MFRLEYCFLAFATLLRLVYGDTCSDVEDLTSVKVTGPLDLAYIDEQQEYWSTSCSALKPSCIIFPTSTSEVSSVVKILADNGERFAVKSGGHSPNNYWASVDNGPLIAMQDLNHVIVDQATGIVKFGPGNRLDDLAQKLDGTGWSVAGGRIGNTGSGGLVLGGGLSYMSTQIGWTASTAIEYEMVFANGTAATITASNHPNLFRALKGGGNNFGIITSYTVQALRQGNIWGGNLAFLHTPQTASKLLQAVRDFTEYNTDPKAAVILTAERTNVNLVDTWIMFLFYDGVVVPQDLFKNFTDAGPITNDVRIRSYADFVTFSNWVVLKGSVVTIATETIPLPSAADGKQVMESIHTFWRDITSQNLLVPGIVASIAYQPFPKRIARKALDAGGDLIDCDDNVDRLIIEMNYAFTLPSDYPKMNQTMQQTYGGIREMVIAWQRNGTLADEYMPIFMNYAYQHQDYFGRLRPASRALAKSVADEVDPNGLFREKTGGWKP